MRRVPLVLALGFLLAALPAPAEAKNMQGKLGFGYQLTLAGAQGVSFTYWALERLAVQVMAGAEFRLDRKNEVSSAIHFGIGGRFVLLATRYANLSLGLRAALGYAPNLWITSTVTRCTPDGADLLCADETSRRTASNVVEVAVEAPVEVEFFFSDSFSVLLGAGVMAVFVPKEGEVLHPLGLGAVHEAGHKGIGIGTGAAFGSAAFNFYL